MLTGYVNRRRIEREQALSLAWHVEAFARHKKLPTLEKVLGRRAAPKVAKVQNSDEMLKALRVWAALTNEGSPT